MKRVLIIIIILSFGQISLCFCQKGFITSKNYIAAAYSPGLSNLGCFEFGYERMITVLKIQTGLKISFIPSYQYDPVSNISVLSEYKNYYKQNLLVFETAPYLFIGKSKKNTGFYLKGGLNIIPFRLKYDYKRIPPADTIISERTDKYKMLFGFTGSAGFQFPLFKYKKSGRIELGSRFAGFGHEPHVIMFMVTTGIGL